MRALGIFLSMYLALSALLSIVPTVAASDYILGIFGNANMDDTIEGFDLAPIRRALNSCVNIFNFYGRF